MTLTIESLTNGKISVSFCWDKSEGYIVSVRRNTSLNECIEIKKVYVKDEKNGLRTMKRNFEAYTGGQHAIL